MLVPRNTTRPIFYACPDALQMIYNETIFPGRIAICKAVLLLTTFIINHHDAGVISRLPGLNVLPVFSSRDGFLPIYLDFKIDTKDKLNPDLNKVLLLTSGYKQ
jgi:hypothetical protein